jgi:outer membrane protein assembly factor BamA
MTNPAKIRRLLAALVLLFILLVQFSPAQNPYFLHPSGVDCDSSTLIRETGMQTAFASRLACVEYVNKLPSVLQAKGFVTASLDSILLDSASAKIIIYLGQRYQWAQIKVQDTDPQLLAVSGWNERSVNNKPLDFTYVKTAQDRMLDWLENNGYPFAKIYLDSIQLDNEKVSANLVIDKGPLYKIDSTRIFGTAKISNYFLQHYLDIKNGSIYSRNKIVRITPRLRQLSFITERQPADLSLLGTGSVLNLYIDQKKSSQFNALIGFLPDNQQLENPKLLIVGEANIHLRNAFGNGEAIGLNWQQLQVKSPRLNIYYRHPYVFRSPFGIDFSFDMLRKDTSYLNINMNLGTSYEISETQTGKVFFQHFQTIIGQGGINESQIIDSKKLPDVSDMSVLALGVETEKRKTNYRLNPRKGYEYIVNLAAGTKKIKKNTEILELKDPSDPSFDFESLYDTVKLKTYQFRLVGTAAKYFPVGKQGTFKTAFNGGLYYSDHIYRNELFQIGGYKLLRGFDEESQYASQYAIGTLEYRYLIGLNSFFYGFVDGGWARNTAGESDYSHTYIGTGLGLALETKAGIFNLAWAVGKRDDIPMNLRQSKIHVGFVNYF